MDYWSLHPWKVSIQEAILIQQNLRKRIILVDKLPKIQKIAGVDVAFFDNQAICAICVFESRPCAQGRGEYPELNLIEKTYAKDKISFPYVPGLLTFREGPVILKAFRKLKNKPDLVLFDGQGICHPRRMGVATHLGIVLDLPSIGCAKSHLCGVYKMPKEDKGSFSYIHNKKTKELLGVALRTRRNVKPLFVSCGYKISLKQAIHLVLKLCPKYRISQPLRFAHQLAEEAKNKRCVIL
jgi:deoxyribonuclease V